MLRRKYPNAPGRLVLQDLPVVINAIQQLDPKIERMTHDFYTEQPVKGTFRPSFPLIRAKLTSHESRPCILHALRPPRLAR
jgi:hypothetical protein